MVALKRRVESRRRKWNLELPTLLFLLCRGCGSYEISTTGHVCLAQTRGNQTREPALRAGVFVQSAVAVLTSGWCWIHRGWTDGWCAWGIQMHLATLGACASLMQKSGLCRASADNGRTQCKPVMEAGEAGKSPHAKVEQELESLFKSTSQRHPWPLDGMTSNDV